MNIAIFGATSYLARDLIVSFSRNSHAKLDLYGRNAASIHSWLDAHSLANHYSASHYSAFNSNLNYDAIINFVGIGNPAQAILCSTSIFDVTQAYDDLALNYLQNHPDTKYIFLSSGAVYGQAFSEPVNENSTAYIDINNLTSTDYYGLAKLYAEAKHRNLTNLNIVDLRVFNYFSASMDVSARFFISDVLRAIREDTVLQTSTSNMYRDYLHPDDLYQLINCVLAANKINQSLDCYTKAPIDKMTLLDEMKIHFGLKYICTEQAQTFGVNATGLKDNYFSLNTRAALIGYKPTRTALECVLKESATVLHAN